MEIFDSKKGIIADTKEYVRDVSADLAGAEVYIRGLKAPVYVEELIKTVQKTFSLTNDEVYGIIKKVDYELKPKDVPVEPIIEE